MRIAVLFSLVVMAALALPAPASARVEVFERVGIDRSLAFDDLFSGARHAAMAHADLAGTRDASAVWTQPGALMLAGDGASVVFGTTDDVGPWPRSGEASRLGALTAELRRGRLRVGIGARRLETDPILLRTAFQPEGERVELARRHYVFALALDARRRSTAPRSWELCVGAAVRQTSEEIGDARWSAHPIDVGVTSAWHSGAGEGVFVLAAGVVANNLFGADVEHGSLSVELPRLLRAGVTAEAAWRRGPTTRPLLLGRVAFAHTRDLEDSGDDLEHVGVEAVVLDTVALRWGHETFDDAESGLGVAIGTDLGRRAHLTLEWARASRDADRHDRAIDVWGVRLVARP